MEPTQHRAADDTWDRTSDLYGPKATHPFGTAWPARVDQHLADGIAEQHEDRWALSACLLHSNGFDADTSRQVTRLNTRMKQAAPQALIVAP